MTTPAVQRPGAVGGPARRSRDGGSAIAEFVLAAVLAQDKQLHRSARLQREHRWVHRELRRTQGSTALVVGTGGIGRATARLL